MNNHINLSVKTTFLCMLDFNLLAIKLTKIWKYLHIKSQIDILENANMNT